MEQTKKYSDGFCQIYNELGWNYYPEIVGEQILDWIEENALTITSAIDLGCGTGVLCEIFHKNGIRTAGLDLSEDMIEIARERNGEIPFAVADITTYIPEETYDLVTSTGDVVNNFYHEEDMLRLFRNVHGYLNEGGFFLFDMLNEEEEIYEEPFELDYDEHTHVRMHTMRHENNMIELNTTVYKDGIMEVDEHVVEKLYEKAAMERMVLEAGFSKVSFTNCISKKAGQKGTALYAIARK